MHFCTVPVSVALLAALSLVSAAPGLVEGKEVAVVELVSYPDRNLFYPMLVSFSFGPFRRDFFRLTSLETFKMRRPYSTLG